MRNDPDQLAATKEWSVRIFISEHGGATHAEARLDTGAGTSLTGSGAARLNSTDVDVPEIGDELAVARALSRLADVLLRTAEKDIEEVTGQQLDRPADTARS
jgi:hypothetical protein